MELESDMNRHVTEADILPRDDAAMGGYIRRPVFALIRAIIGRRMAAGSAG